MRLNKLLYCCSVIATLMLLPTINAQAQIFPGEGAKLNYRLVGFVVPAGDNAVTYEVEIASGNLSTEADFKKNYIKKINSKVNELRDEIPEFGKEYTWRWVSTDKKGKKSPGYFMHFSTLTSESIDTGLIRMRILQQATKYADAYVFCDNTKALYNMKGQPIWFLPDVDGKSTTKAIVRDLKITSRGTITFLMNDHPYEVDYSGKVLWEHKDTTVTNGRFHHEFTRLANGNYMVMGTENVLCKLSGSKDSLPQIWQDKEMPDSSKARFRKIPFTTVMEYNPLSIAVWGWHSSSVFNAGNMQDYVKPNMRGFALHENAFYLNSAAKTLYVSSKQYGIVFKVNYADSSLMAIYGDKYTATDKKESLFCEQHACKVSQDGYLYLFNNNECNPDEVPTLVMLQEPGNATEAIKKIWEYKCPVQAKEHGGKKRNQVTSGGNVIELPGKELLASMSSPYADMFIVSRDKKLLWHSILEKKTDVAQNKWEPLSQYRASIVCEKELVDKLVFGKMAPTKSKAPTYRVIQHQ